MKSLSKRLVSLATARKRKGDLARNYNSAADYIFITPDTQSLNTLRSVTPQTDQLSKNQSTSLDSVFTNSSSGTVHLLNSSGELGKAIGELLSNIYLYLSSPSRFQYKLVLSSKLVRY